MIILYFYYICYVFLTKDLEVAFFDMVKILPKINIVNQETYDVNIELIFNGRGQLHNKKIP